MISPSLSSFPTFVERSEAHWISSPHHLVALWEKRDEMPFFPPLAVALNILRTNKTFNLLSFSTILWFSSFFPLSHRTNTNPCAVCCWKYVVSLSLRSFRLFGMFFCGRPESAFLLFSFIVHSLLQPLQFRPANNFFRATKIVYKRFHVAILYPFQFKSGTWLHLMFVPWKDVDVSVKGNEKGENREIANNEKNILNVAYFIFFVHRPTIQSFFAMKERENSMKS